MCWSGGHVGSELTACCPHRAAVLERMPVIDKNSPGHTNGEIVGGDCQRARPRQKQAGRGDGDATTCSSGQCHHNVTPMYSVVFSNVTKLHLLKHCYLSQVCICMSLCITTGFSQVCVCMHKYRCILCVWIQVYYLSQVYVCMYKYRCIRQVCVYEYRCIISQVYVCVRINAGVCTGSLSGVCKYRCILSQVCVNTGVFSQVCVNTGVFSLRCV